METLEPGSDYRCIICGNKDGFLPWNKRKNAYCPGCGSVERHRHLYIHLAAILPLLGGKRLLHFAPEPIIKKIILSCPLDFTYYDVDYIPEKATYVADIRNLDFEDNFFDYILAVHVLEHIDDDAKAIRELHRVLKTGGKLFLMVPLMHQYHNQKYFRTDGSPLRHLLKEDVDKTFELPGVRTSEECFALYGQEDHLRVYGLADLCARLEKQRFSVEVARPEGFPERIRREGNLIDDVIFARK